MEITTIKRPSRVISYLDVDKLLPYLNCSRQPRLEIRPFTSDLVHADFANFGTSP